MTLIGANGAGKTTTLRTITGLLEPRQGRVIFEGEDIGGKPTHKLVARGISMSPEGRGVFANLSVRENLQMGAYLNQRQDEKSPPIWSALSRCFRDLKSASRRRPGRCPAVNSRCWRWARALMSNPRLLLLDEPSLGLAPLVVHTIFEAIDEIRGKGTTILLVEQNAHAALGHSDRAYVLETGRIVMEGPSKELAADPRIKEAYLGEYDQISRCADDQNSPARVWELRSTVLAVSVRYAVDKLPLQLPAATLPCLRNQTSSCLMIWA